MDALVKAKFLFAGIVVLVLAALGGARMVQITGSAASVGGVQEVRVVIDDGSNLSAQDVTLDPMETAFDALKRAAVVDYEIREPSVTIIAINGIRQDQGHYWTFLVNEKIPSYECDYYYPVSGDVIKFKYAAIE